MDVSPADGLLGSDTAEIMYGDTIEIPDDAWWESILSTAHSNATEVEALSVPTTIAFGWTPPSPNSIESAGHELVPVNRMLPYKLHDVRCIVEQQPQASVLAAETKNYDTDHKDHLLGFEEPSSQSGALPVNRAEYTTSGNPIKPYFRAVEDNRHAQEWNAIYWGSHEKTSAEPPSSPSPVWQHKYQVNVPPADDPTSSYDLAQQGSTLGISSTFPSTSATTSLPINENWKCDTCGAMFTTKGTKNRNRNKKRHRCPGTGLKYPCPICPKSFNRGDSRLVHLRRSHPEMHTQPPRPRKGKDLNEARMN